MKKFNTRYAQIVLAAMLFTSCSTGGIYQVMQANPVPDELGLGVEEQSGRITFENGDVRVVYNLWARGGAMGFTIANKTDKPLYIDWGKSHLIQNGFSYDYWEDIEESTSFYASGSSSFGAGYARSTSTPAVSSTHATMISSTSKSSVSSTEKHKPKRVVQIPPQSSLAVSKFRLVGEPYYNCDYNWSTVNRTKEPRLDFDMSTTPLSLRNYLTYSSSDQFTDIKIIDNGFYVNAVEFFSSRRFKGPLRSSTNCNVMGYRNSSPSYAYPARNSRSFYLYITAQ